MVVSLWSLYHISERDAQSHAKKDALLAEEVSKAERLAGELRLLTDERDSAIRQNADISRSLQEEKARQIGAREELISTRKEHEQTEQSRKMLSERNAFLEKESVRMKNALSETDFRLKQLESALAAHKAANHELDQRLKRSLSRYTAEQTLRIGSSVVDKLTGLSIGIREISSFNTLFGQITFPDGKSQSIFDSVGTSWRYRWNERQFMVAVSPSGSPGTLLVTVTEITEEPEPTTTAATPRAP